MTSLLGAGCRSVVAAPPAAAGRSDKVVRSDAEWRSRLDQRAYAVMRQRATEPAFSSPYWNDHRAAVYRCAGCGRPLFRSEAKFDSGTGWPSFTRPIGDDAVATAVDTSLGAARTEVHCPRCGGHLGHVFDDGPAPTHKRYCMNGAALSQELDGQSKGVALFAGGCFWCMETAFEGLPGVKEVISGYSGGSEVNPSYHDVGAGKTGHAETVRVVYDPATISYARLLEIFWQNIDPLSAEGQFCDRGHQYRSAIFYLDAEQRALAEASRRKVAARLGKEVATEVVAAGAFYPAEEYHQDFYKKDPERYHSYRNACGRDRRLKELQSSPPPAK